MNFSLGIRARNNAVVESEDNAEDVLPLPVPVLLPADDERRRAVPSDALELLEEDERVWLSDDRVPVLVPEETADTGDWDDSDLTWLVDAEGDETGIAAEEPHEQQLVSSTPHYQTLQLEQPQPGIDEQELLLCGGPEYSDDELEALMARCRQEAEAAQDEDEEEDRRVADLLRHDDPA